MKTKRKLELFDEMIDYLCGLDTERCIYLLETFGITKSEAEELGFFDFITEQLEDYDEED